MSPPAPTGAEIKAATADPSSVQIVVVLESDAPKPFSRYASNGNGLRLRTDLEFSLRNREPVAKGSDACKKTCEFCKTAWDPSVPNCEHIKRGSKWGPPCTGMPVEGCNIRFASGGNVACCCGAYVDMHTFSDRTATGFFLFGPGRQRRDRRCFILAFSLIAYRPRVDRCALSCNLWDHDFHLTSTRLLPTNRSSDSEDQPPGSIAVPSTRSVSPRGLSLIRGRVGQRLTVGSLYSHRGCPLYCSALSHFVA